MGVFASPFFIFFGICQFFLSLNAGTEQRTKKNLVLIVASDKLVCYKAHTTSWRRYMHKFPENFECWFVKSDPDMEVDHKFVGDVLWVKEKDSLCPGVMDKTIHAMEVFLPRLQEFDFIIRPNQSSFVVLPNLFNFLEKLPSKRCFAGSKSFYGKATGDVHFVGGACYILSKDLVRLMVSQKVALVNLPPVYDNRDDLALSRFFMDTHKIEPFYHPLFSLEDRFAHISKAYKDFPEDVFHFRIKHNNVEETRRYTLEKMIHEFLYDYYYL
jgi:hypothetical protein